MISLQMQPFCETTDTIFWIMIIPASCHTDRLPAAAFIYLQAQSQLIFLK